MSTWYTIVTRGTDCTVPRGPWRTTDEAYDAVARWKTQRGHLAGGELARAHSAARGALRLARPGAGG
jgi:hypothetical protein